MSLGTAYTNSRHTSVTQRVELDTEADHNYTAARDLLTQLDRDHPGDPKYRSLLAEAHHLLGSLRRRLGNSEQSLADYKASLDILEELVRKHADVPQYQFLLGSVRHARGFAYLLLGRLEEARADYDKAAEVIEPLARQYEDTRRPEELGTRPYFYQEELGRLSYDRACLDGLSVAAVKKNSQVPAAERDRRIDQYTKDAFIQLLKAWTAWLRDVPGDPIQMLESDHDLNPLPREEFRKLIAGFKDDLRRRRATGTR
jgi:tetratricopeptide (TPR) repeat protein